MKKVSFLKKKKFFEKNLKQTSPKTPQKSGKRPY